MFKFGIAIIITAVLLLIFRLAIGDVSPVSLVSSVLLGVSGALLAFTKKRR